MKGYYNDPDATAMAFAGGWFHSGDVAVRHPDGYVEIVRPCQGRHHQRRGERLHAVQVEEGVIADPTPSWRCAVVAVPHEKWGEVPNAFVTLKVGRIVASGG